MMHAIRKVAREIHRRSVWQVVIVYLTGSWVGLKVVEAATQRAGLPAWTPTMALVLLAIGFPIVTATALVQGGLPWLRIEDWVDPNELEGLTPDEVLVIPQLHPLYGVGLLTWRNAVLGGVMALALLVTSVVAYLTMWGLGIGPVGSLMAQGWVSEGDRVLVAAFANHTDRAVLGPALTDALLADMAQSELFEVVDAAALSALLASPADSGSADVVSRRGRRLAEEAGVGAVVEGEVSRSENGYLITVSIVLPSSRSPVSRFRETPSDAADLIPAVDALSERVRAKLGESLRVIRAGPPLTELYGPEVAAPRR